MNTTPYEIFSGLALSRPGIATVALALAATFPLTLNISVKFMTLLVRRVNILGIHPSVASISSVLLNLMTLVPAALLLWCLNVLVPFDCIYDLLILLFCFDLASLRRSALDCAYQLRHGNKEEARNAVRPFVLREVDTLSHMGIAKAATESLPLNILEGIYVPLFWYLLFGPTMAFLSTFAVIMNKAANPKLPGNFYFGRLNVTLARTFCLFPGFLMLAMLGLATSFPALKKAWEQRHLHPNVISALVIATLGSYLDISLGGPRIYNGEKIRLANLGGITDPAPVHIEIIWRRVRNSILFLVLFMLLIRIIFLL